MRQCVLVDGAFDAPDPLVASLLRVGFAPPMRCTSLAQALAAVASQRIDLLILPVSAIAASERQALENLLRDSPALAIVSLLGVLGIAALNPSFLSPLNFNVLLLAIAINALIAMAQMIIFAIGQRT